MPVAETFEILPWREAYSRIDWRQGEHVTLIGVTGEGKSTLTREILNKRDYVMVLRNKRDDETLDGFEGYYRSSVPQDWMRRVMVSSAFPREPKRLFDVQAKVFDTALHIAYRQGGWTVVADEIRYLVDKLKLKQILEILWLQGRSLGVSLVASTQRPRHIPLEAYDQATHLFLWRDTDMGNVARLVEIGGGVDSAALMERIPNLPKYQFIYINTRTGEVFESKVEL